MSIYDTLAKNIYNRMKLYVHTKKNIIYATEGKKETGNLSELGSIPKTGWIHVFLKHGVEKSTPLVISGKGRWDEKWAKIDHQRWKTKNFTPPMAFTALFPHGRGTRQ